MEHHQPEETWLERAAPGDHPGHRPGGAVAGISERPNAFFRLSPAESGKAQCFAIQRGGIERRADVIFHQPWVHARLAALESARFPTEDMGQVIEVIRYGTSTPPPYVEPGHESAPFVRATDIKDGEVRLDSLLHIEAAQPKQMDKCRLSGGELIIVRSGANTGDCAVVPNSLAGAYAAYDLILTFRATAQALFIAMFLDTEAGRLQLNLVRGRAAQPHVNAEEVSALRVPLPPPKIQERLITAMETARAERRAKLAEADALLAGLDDYLLATLGLTPPPKDERRVFAVSTSALGSQARLNADYFHPERILAIRALADTTQQLDCPRLEQVVDFIRDQIKMPGLNYLSLANVQSNTGELVPTNEEVTGACSIFQRGDVLFARLRPYLNKVHVAEKDGCCSPEFHVLRVKNNETLHPDYLAPILRSSLTLAQTRHMMTGNTHPRLTNEDVVNLVIPVPKPTIQEAIAVEASRRREEARRLRTEAEAGWKAAKRWFEEQLLGPVQPR